VARFASDENKIKINFRQFTIKIKRAENQIGHHAFYQLLHRTPLVLCNFIAPV
jgi:glucose-6-phosphate isomerase